MRQGSGDAPSPEGENDASVVCGRHPKQWELPKWATVTSSLLPSDEASLLYLRADCMDSA